MAIFEEVVLTWEGREYKIPAEHVLRAIAVIEDILTAGDLGEAAATQRYPVGKMSMAFGRLLRLAGARVTDDEVYLGMYKNAADLPRRVIDTLHTLQMMMIPPPAMRSEPAKKPVVVEPEGSSPPPTD